MKRISYPVSRSKGRGPSNPGRLFTIFLLQTVFGPIWQKMARTNSTASSDVFMEKGELGKRGEWRREIGEMSVDRGRNMSLLANGLSELFCNVVRERKTTCGSRSQMPSLANYNINLQHSPSSLVWAVMESPLNHAWSTSVMEYSPSLPS